MISPVCQDVRAIWVRCGLYRQLTPTSAVDWPDFIQAPATGPVARRAPHGSAPA